MASEKKTNGRKITVELSDSLLSKFARHCKKLNVSMAQRVRDIMQKDMKK